MTESDKLFEIRGDAKRIDVRWRGRWDEPTADAYSSALVEAIEKLKGGRPNLVIDATQLASCNILARGRLADLQETVRPLTHRCAYLATSPRMRGLCLWIVKVGGDAAAKVVGNPADIDPWLSSEATRLGDAQSRIMTQLGRVGRDAS